jgi:hypothetical protein
MSPKMLSWNKKLAMWRKNHRRADGTLPSLKSAMKACKGRRASTKRCRRRKSFRKHRVASPKRMSPLRKASAQMKAKLSPKRKSARPVFGPQTRQAYEKRTGLKVQSAQKKQQSSAKKKPAVFGQNAPANPMFVPGTVKKQQSPAAQKKQQKPAQKKQQSPAAQKKQQKPAQKKQQSPAAQKKQQKPAQKKPQFGPNARQGAMFGRPARFA